MSYGRGEREREREGEGERGREGERERGREGEKCDWLGTWLLEAHTQNFLRKDWNQMGRVNLTIALIDN